MRNPVIANALEKPCRKIVRGDGDVRFGVGELGVNFVGDDEQVVLAANRGDLLQFCASHDAAGRIGREIKQQHF